MRSRGYLTQRNIYASSEFRTRRVSGIYTGIWNEYYESLGRLLNHISRVFSILFTREKERERKNDLTFTIYKLKTLASVAPEVYRERAATMLRCQKKWIFIALFSERPSGSRKIERESEELKITVMRYFRILLRPHIYIKNKRKYNTYNKYNIHHFFMRIYNIY